MIQLYRLLSRKSDPSFAMYVFLLFNIAFWFLAGAFAGVIFAFCFLENTRILSFALTSGSLLAMTIGYVYGCIRVYKNMAVKQ